MRLVILSAKRTKGFEWLLFAVCLCLIPFLGGLHAEEGAVSSVTDHMTFSIKDIDGQQIHPFQVNDAKGSVLIFVTHDCPISNAYAPEMSRLRNEYEEKGFKMMLVYVDPDASDENIKTHMRDFSLNGYTAIADKTHRLVKVVGATVTPEVALVLPDGSLSYRGRIDNMYPALGQRRRVITEKDLRNALNAIVENEPVTVSRTQAIGCYMPNLQF